MFCNDEYVLDTLTHIYIFSNFIALEGIGCHFPETYCYLIENLLMRVVAIIIVKSGPTPYKLLVFSMEVGPNFSLIFQWVSRYF
jgi:hypothetical protein